MSRSARPTKGAARPSRPRSSVGWTLALVALVALVVVLGYAHTLRYPLHFDDFASIEMNRSLRQPWNWPFVWSFRPSRFVLYLSFALNEALTGRDTTGLHVVNLLIHFANALLVGWIARELARGLATPPANAARGGGAQGATLDRARRIGLVAALLFAAHPLATQAVTYLVQRTTSLAAGFELAAVALYLRARSGPGRAWPAWIAAWACGLLGALTKEMVVALPLLVATIEGFLRAAAPRGAPAGGKRARWMPLAPFALVVPLVAWSVRLPARYLEQPITGLAETSAYSPGAYLLTQVALLPRYLALWFWPAGQNLDPEVTLRHGVDAPVLLGLVLIASLLALAWTARRRAPLVTLGLAWFAIAMLPESSLFPITDMMQEHRMYFPMVGLAMASAWALAALPLRGRARLLAPAALVAALALVTHQRNRVWSDERALWTDVARKSPHKARGFNNLGMTVERGGDIVTAESLYVRATRLDPTDVDSRFNLGRLMGAEHRTDSALRVLAEAHRIDPTRPDVMVLLGNQLWAAGDTARAAEMYEAAHRRSPALPDPVLDLARMRGLPPGKE